MLRITTCQTPVRNCLIVEGRLAGLCVVELEKCWRAAATRESSCLLLVDLSAVTFIDATGKQLLTLMHKQGIRFVATGLMTKFIIDEIENAGISP